MLGVSEDHTQHGLASWFTFPAMSALLVTCLLLVRVGWAIRQAEKDTSDEAFRTKVIRGLCCGGRRYAWRNKCQGYRRNLYDDAFAIALGDAKVQSPYTDSVQ
jgi:hypothetical protein